MCTEKKALIPKELALSDNLSKEEEIERLLPFLWDDAIRS